MFKKRVKLSDRNGKDSKRKKISVEVTDFESDFESDDERSINLPPVIKKRHLFGETSEISTYKADETNDNIVETKYKLTEDDSATKVDILNSERIEQDKENRETLNRTKKTSVSAKISQPSNVRTTVVTDYQPDICKDYQQTGYCGYGDSCKFLHSRDDFKAGWKLNQEWKIDTDDKLGDDNKNKSVALEDIPFKCVLCKEEYKNPIVTSCNHYFCSSCFTERVETSTKCFICNKDTQGVAKVARELKKYLKKKET